MADGRATAVDFLPKLHLWAANLVSVVPFHWPAVCSKPRLGNTPTSTLRFVLGHHPIYWELASSLDADTKVSVRGRKYHPCCSCRPRAAVKPNFCVRNVVFTSSKIYPWYLLPYIDCEQPCTTTHRKRKGLSICHSLLSQDLVSLLAFGGIQPAPAAPPLLFRGVGGTRALAHSIYYIYSAYNSFQYSCTI